MSISIKPLEWVKPDPRYTLSRAETILGTYRVWTHHEAEGKWFWSGDGEFSETVASEAEGIAAAKADYEARIRSALSSLAPVEAVATEPEAEKPWGWANKNGAVTRFHPEKWREIGYELTPLYTAPTGDSGALREALAAGCYMMTEPHLSGYRLIIGFDTLPAVQNAMQAVVTALSKGEPGK